MTERHFGPVEVEEVHELDRLAVPKSAVVDAAWLVVELEVNWEDFHMFCNIQSEYNVYAIRLRHTEERVVRGLRAF